MRSIRMKETHFPLIMEDGPGSQNAKRFCSWKAAAAPKTIWYTPTTASAMTVP